MTKSWGKLNVKNYGLSRLIGSTIGWIGWDILIIIITCSLTSKVNTTNLTGSTGSTWISLITWSMLTSSSFSRLACVVIVYSYSSSPPPIFSKHVLFLSSSELTIWTLKIVLNFFLSNEVIGLGFNLFCGVGGFIHIFSLWHWRFEKGDAIVNHVGFHSLRNYFVATLALGLRPKQGPTKVWTKSEPRSHISCSWECKRVWGNEPPHSQMSSHFGSWSPNGLPNLQRVIAGVKTHWIEKFIISLESSWNTNV